MSIASLWKKLRPSAQRPATMLGLVPQGFSLSNGERTVTIAWADITDVTAFKRDLMTVDLMCMRIDTADMAIEVDEEMPGYAAFDEACHEALGISIAWKLDVMFPAFETNPTRIYPASSTLTGAR